MSLRLLGLLKLPWKELGFQDPLVSDRQHRPDLH